MNADDKENSSLAPRQQEEAAPAARGPQPQPFRTADEATRAAELYVNGKTTPHQRRVICDRLRVTPRWAASFLPIFAKRFHIESIGERQRYLEIFGELLEKGADISVVADAVARLLNDTNYQLRQSACALLLRMGPQAAPAVARIICALSSPIPDAQISALRLLAAIGPRAAGRAAPKIRQILNGSPSAEFSAVAEETLQVLDIDTPDPAALAAAAPSPFPGLVRKRVLCIAPAPAAMAAGPLDGLFSKNGALVTVVANGKQIAAAFTAELPYDLVLVDLAHLNAIGLDAAKVLQAMRLQPTLAQTLVYVVANQELDAAAMLKLAKYAVAGYLRLPMRPRELLTEMDMAMRREGERFAERALAAALEWLEANRPGEQLQGLLALALLGPQAAAEGLPALAPAGGAPEMVAAEDKVRAILIVPPTDPKEQWLPHCRALVAEGNPVIGGLLRRALERHGATVCQVGTLGGLASALAAGCDLAVVATEFGGAGAGAGIRKIRQHPAFAVAPLIVYGPAADTHELPFLAAARPAAYLAMPFGEEELLGVVVKALERK